MHPKTIVVSRVSDFLPYYRAVFSQSRKQSLLMNSHSPTQSAGDMAYKRMLMSRQSTRHSLRPSRLRNHSMPKPVHSCLCRASSSAAAPARALAVELMTSTTEALKLVFGSSSGSGREEGGRGWNQLLLKSKKQRSDQLHEVRKRINSRKLQ